MAPLITDGPIIIAALWFLSQFRSIDLFAAVLSICGGLYLLWLSQRMFRVHNISISSKLGSGASLGTAIKVNLLNPGPYLFWFTVGGISFAAQPPNALCLWSRPLERSSFPRSQLRY